MSDIISNKTVTLTDNQTGSSVDLPLLGAALARMLLIFESFMHRQGNSPLTRDTGLRALVFPA